jgi:peptidoglycan/xylan/chitin deacetylase (PgdA/CDA1 family)
VTGASVSERLRERVKTTVEHFLISSGAAAFSRWRHNNGAFILAYHNVIPDGAAACSDVSLHVTRSKFAAQLDALMKTHDVVGLDEALSPPGPGRRSRRPVAAITFDDAYRGALTLGMREVRERGLEATTFVAPAYLGGSAFWWDEVDWPADSEEGDRFRARALSECRGRDSEIRVMASSVGYGTIDVPSYARCVTGPELRDAVGQGSLTIGAHTWSHANLAALDDEALAEELAKPLDWLRGRFDSVKPWLAYPYGLWSPRVVDAAQRAGYTLAVRVDGGWLRGRSNSVDVYTLPRYNVAAGLTSEGFALRASGMFCQ